MSLKLLSDVIPLLFVLEYCYVCRVSACLISMLLIVYGSFRSLNMEREARERAEREREATLLGGKPATTSSSSNSSKFIALHT